MFIRDNPYVAILCLTAVIASCVALTAWTRREIAPATRPFTGLMVAIAFYAIAAAANAATVTLRPSIFWGTLEYITSNSVIVLYLTFALYFTGRKQWLRPRRRLLIWAMPIFNMLLVITNHWHHLVWTQWTLPTRPGQFVTASHGIGYFWIAACFYIYVLTGSALVGRVAISASHLYRRQATIILSSTVPPIIAGSLYVLEIVPLGVNILPMSFLVTGLIYFASLFRFRLFDLLPIARDVVIERMSEGVILLDEEGRVIDLNPAARRYALQNAQSTGLKISASIGQPVAKVLSDWPEIISCCQSKNDITTEIIHRPEVPCYIEVRVTQLCESQAQMAGKLLVLRDITQQQQIQMEIQQTNALLKSQLREIQALRDQLKEQAIRDRLTGLFNRRYFDETMPAELSKSNRSGSSLAVMMLDIDYFKKINDCYGHLAGDHALRVFADTLRAHIRQSDLACRYGGEEFVIALPEMSLSEAVNRANGIRQAFKAITFTFAEFRFTATVSIGVGLFSRGSENQDQLMRKVDQALYAAKKRGRDRVEIALEKSARTTACR